ncbi:MAG: hypothetical protein JW856_02915 [Dehalococcoidales bacterium]|nr:hypothetical protein [Dehalococcoidales bacterium]
MWKIDKGSLTGNTAASYTNALSWNVDELREKTILLKNTDASLSLKFRLLAYAVSGGNSLEEIGETILSAGQTAKIQFIKQWAVLILQVIDGSGHAAYRIDYIGQGA